jgi:hypothetical protein
MFSVFVDNRDGNGAMGMERVMNEQFAIPAKRSKPLNACDSTSGCRRRWKVELACPACKSNGCQGRVRDRARRAKTGEVVAMAHFPVVQPQPPGRFANIPNDLGETHCQHGRYPDFATDQ